MHVQTIRPNNTSKLKMVGRVGIEPTTRGLRVRCSTNWANDPSQTVTYPMNTMVFTVLHLYNLHNGVDDGAWTHDNRNHNPGLYQLSYAHHQKTWEPSVCSFVPHITLQLAFRNRLLTNSLQHNGTPGRIRTCYPRLSLPTTAFAAVLAGVRYYRTHYKRTFVVWTISSPFQVPHVWPLRNPTIITAISDVTTLIILRCFYPQGDRLVKILWIKIITFISIRAINTIKIYGVFIDGLHMRTIFICPTRSKMHSECTGLVQRFVFNLNPFEHVFSISDQIKRSMFRDRLKY